MKDRLLHPWVQERRLALARSGREALRRWRRALLDLLGVGAVLALAVLTFLDAAARAGPALSPLLARPWLLAAAAGGLGLGAGGAAARAVSRELATGWWGAAPIARSVAVRTVLLAGLAAAAAAGALSAGTLLALGAAAALPIAPHLAGALVLAALAGGAAAAVMALPRLAPRAGNVRAPREGPCTAPIAALDGAHLPELARWQRGEALSALRWSALRWLVALVLLLGPAEAPVATKAGLVLAGLGLAAAGSALAGGRSVTFQASALLRATPVDFGLLARAVGRLPLLATAAAAAVIAGGLVTAGAPGALALGVGGLVVAVAVLEQAVVLHHRLGRMRAGLGLGLDLTLLAVLAQVAWPVVPLAYGALVAGHLRAAARVR